MGKWTRFKDKLQRYEHESEYQTAVEERKEVHRHSDIAGLAEKFKMAKLEATGHKASLKDLNVDLEALAQLLLERFEGAGLTSVKLASGGTLSEAPVPYPKLVDEEKFLKWLPKKYPNERLKFPWPSLERMVKHHLEEGMPTPPGVEVFLKNTVRLYGGGLSGGEEN